MTGGSIYDIANGTGVLSNMRSIFKALTSRSIVESTVHFDDQNTQH